MHLAVISHKICRKSGISPSGFATDGGFPRQMEAISELFDSTKIIVPVERSKDENGLSPLVGKNVKIRKLSVPKGAGLRRKLDIPFWLARDGKIIWQEIKRADAVHALIPGDVGTIGLLFALLQRKPLFVRHCGNWLVQRTAAEKFWKWLIEKFAGGRNLMLATGGANRAPSEKNPNVKWIFSTSLREKEIAAAKPRSLTNDGKIKLLIACRQEPRKGTSILIESLPLILENFPNASLDVVGGGSLLDDLKVQAKILGIEQKIIFHGKIEQAKVIELMKRAHVFCFPTSASEGFPKVVLEALACGLPVVTTKVSVLPQLITGENGFLLDEPSPHNLAKAVEKICFDAKQYKKMSERAIETAREYSLENWRDRIGDHLRQTWNVASLSEKDENAARIERPFFQRFSAEQN